MRLTSAQHQRTSVAYDQFMLHYSWLTKHSIENGILCYNFVGKHYMMWQFVDKSKWTAGTPTTSISPKVADNAAMALRLTARAFAAP